MYLLRGSKNPHTTIYAHGAAIPFSVSQRGSLGQHTTIDLELLAEGAAEEDKSLGWMISYCVWTCFTTVATMGLGLWVREIATRSRVTPETMASRKIRIGNSRIPPMSESKEEHLRP